MWFLFSDFSTSLTISQKYSNVEFLKPLAQKMRSMDPEQRPDATEAQSRWLQIKETISTANREWRPRPYDENIYDTVTLDVVSLYRFFMYVARVCAQTISGQ